MYNQRMQLNLLRHTPDLTITHGWEAIADFGHHKLTWLRKFIKLENGVPSHDCINYVVERLSPEGFRECFMNWTQDVMQSCPGDIIAIDGKTARGSRDRKNNKNHCTWACKQRLVLGQEATDDKSNEITAIKYDFKAVKHDYFEEVEKGHGRLETRRYWLTSNIDTLSDTNKWAGLKSIVMVERECIKDGVTSIDKRYFINSINPNAKTFAHAVRGHWGVENPLHWRLDVVLGDDASRIKKNHGATIMTSIRHLCMNLFQEEGSKISLAKKKRKSAWSDEYRAKVVFQQ